MAPQLGEIDFRRDLYEFSGSELTRLGCVAASGIPNRRTVVAFFNALQRRIEQRPRRVWIAASLSVPPDLQCAVKALEGEIERGEELEQHLSEKIYDEKSTDGLLNDWRIHHLHLDSRVGNRKFSAPSNPLLFAWFARDDAYLIRLGHHGEFALNALLETVLVEWPFLLETLWEEEGVGGDSWTDAEVRELRERGVTPLPVLSNGKTYRSPGGGIARDGTSCRAVERALDAERNALLWEHRVRDQFEAMCEQSMSSGTDLPEIVHVRLRYRVEGGSTAEFEGCDDRWLLERPR